MWIGYCAFHLGDYKKALEVSKQDITSFLFSVFFIYCLIKSVK